MARKKLPIFERRRVDDGALLGYQVKIRKTGHPAVTKQFDRLADAEAFAVATIAAMSAGTHRDTRETRRITLGDALSRYEMEVLPTKKGAKGLIGYARRWAAHPLARRYVADLRPADFVKYKHDRLKAGVSAGTILRDLGFIRALFGVGIKDWGWPAVNPLAAMTMPKTAKGRDRRLDARPDSAGRTEEMRLIAGARRGQSKALPAIICFALETAMRRGEILDLAWENVDLHRQTAKIFDTKNGDDRVVPLSRKAVKVLNFAARQLTSGKSWRVFGLTDGHAVTHAFARACTRAGIEGLRFHDLRHESVSRLFEKGLNPMEVAAISGHKTLTMLKRYTHLRAEDLAKKLG